MNFYAFKVITVDFVSNIWHVGLTLFIWLEKFRQEKSLWPNLSFLLLYFETVFPSRAGGGGRWNQNKLKLFKRGGKKGRKRGGKGRIIKDENRGIVGHKKEMGSKKIFGLQFWEAFQIGHGGNALKIDGTIYSPV